MSDKSDILRQAQALMQARLVEQSDLVLPCIGLFRARFCEEYILTEERGRMLIPPHIALEFIPAEYLLEAQRYTQLDYDAPTSYVTQEFIESLALLHNLDEEEVSRALAAEIKVFLDGLFRGRRVSLFSLGDFYVTEEVEGVLLLNCVPSSTILELLNQPFSVYKPTLLRESVQFPELQTTSTVAEGATVAQFAITDSITASEEPEKPEVIEQPVQAEAVLVEATSVASPEKKSLNTAPILWISLAVVALLALVVWWLAPKSPAPLSEESKQVAVVKDTIPVAKDTLILTPENPIAIDTIQVSRGSSLAQIARRYYGNVYYWVYIYMANKDSIPDPNNLRYGQTLMVPSLECYDLRKDSLEAVQEAKAWETIIQNRKFESYREQRATISLP
nr:hypothetical protein [uncultured Porphyromonas sp.]